MRLTADRRRGQALFVVVVAAALVLALGSAMIGLALTNTERARTARAEEQLAQAARSGVAQAKFLFWERYQNWVTGQLPPGWPPNGDLGYARQYLSNQLSGVATSGQNLAAGATIELFRMRLAPATVSGVEARGEPVWVVVTARREDPDARSTYVLLRSEATSWDPLTGDAASRLAAGLPADMRTNEVVLRYGGPIFNGFDFVLLANAINCTFCHAQIDNTHRIYNTDPLKYGTFDRVKVACLESLEARGGPSVGYPYTRIAGTLYVQGTVVDAVGNPLSPDGTTGAWSGPVGTAPQAYVSGNPNWDVSPYFARGIKSAEIDADGKIFEDPGATTPLERLRITNFADSHKDGSGNYDQPLGNFYKGYPTDPAQQIDGPVPDKFPVVVKDANFNRIVDDGEWTTHVDPANGFTGTISGGMARVMLPKNGSTPYTHNRLPTGNGVSGVNEAANIPSGGTSGNSVILVGSKTNPIVIDGKVAIDGDAIISGYVKGSGQLLVRGNLYVLGDLSYADGTDVNGKRTFGVASDTTTNAVAYAAGGSIIHGSYLWGDGRSPGWGQGDLQVTGQGNEIPSWKSPGMPIQEVAWWNRTEWTKSMPNYNSGLKQPTMGSTGTPNYGFEGSGYVPRFYTFQQAGEIWLFGPNKNHTDWTGFQTQWNNDSASGGFWMGDGRSDVYKANASKKLSQMGADVPASYITMALDPQSSWVSQSVMRQIQRNAETDRRTAAAGSLWAGETAVRRKYKMDGLFYTSNAILFMSRQSGPDNSGNGEIEFNGAVVAADTGILSPRNLYLNYDYRVKNLLTVEDEEVDLYVVAEREGVR